MYANNYKPGPGMENALNIPINKFGDKATRMFVIQFWIQYTITRIIKHNNTYIRL